MYRFYFKQFIIDLFKSLNLKIKNNSLISLNNSKLSFEKDSSIYKRKLSYFLIKE